MTETSVAPDPLAGVKAGDRDPTWPPAGPPYCAKRSKAVHGYFCTREAGHPGWHVAGGGDVVCEVWPR